jgi:hypothetical protein
VLIAAGRFIPTPRDVILVLVFCKLVHLLQIGAAVGGIKPEGMSEHIVPAILVPTAMEQFWNIASLWRHTWADLCFLPK